MKKKSLTRQIVFALTFLLVGTIAACFIVNSTFLGKYYRMQKKQLLMENFETIQTASSEGTLYTNEYDAAFETMCSTQNLSIIIINSEGTALRSSMSDVNIILRQLLDAMFKSDSDYRSSNQILYQSDEYIIEQISDVSMDNEEYLILIGTLDDGNMIMIRTAMESINESVSIANHFLMYIAFFAVIISVCIGILISRQITRPILRLTEISQKMVNLDFDAKYERRKSKRLKVVNLISGKEARTVDAGTEIDQLGDHMNQLSWKLEQTISELKAANNELMRDIEKKEQIDDMRKEFLSNVSHELKTPLALIQGYAEGLTECINDDPESRDFYCEVIVDEAGKMNRMVKKLLTLNQLEFGKDQVEMNRFNITELIEGIVNSSAILFEKEGITVEMDLPREYVWADEFKIEEVITNYLSNARNHADGEKKIRIFYEKKEGCLRVSVFNTGKNIPEEDLENIWIKFYKVDKARTRAYGGSGIGLSIVRAIMDSHNQKCGAINHPDGVEFWLELDQQGAPIQEPADGNLPDIQEQT